MQQQLSVIMPVYNQENFLAETIQSVLNQTYVEFEFLILDDGSTDTTASIIKTYAAKDDRIKSFFHKNAGRSEATNFLIQKASGSFCALLDADDLMMPERLQKQLQFHLNNKSVDATSVHAYYINTQGAHMGVQHYPSLQTIEDCKQVKQNRSIVLCAITGLMIKREAYIASGGLNKKYWPCDDLEFTNRLIDQDYNVLILQEVLMKYRSHEMSATSSGRWQMFKMSNFTIHCICERRVGRPELSFPEYCEKEKEMTWRTRLKIKMHQSAIFFHRKAGFNLYLKNYGKFVYQIFLATILDYKYVMASFRNRRKVSGKVNLFK